MAGEYGIPSTVDTAVLSMSLSDYQKRLVDNVGTFFAPLLTKFESSIKAKLAFEGCILLAFTLQLPATRRREDFHARYISRHFNSFVDDRRLFRLSSKYRV